MLVAPPHEHDDRCEELAAGLGEPVLVPFGIAGVGDAVEKADVDEHPQPRRQGGARDVEVAGELAEALHPEERLTQDEQRPALTDQLEGPSDRLAVEAMGQLGGVHSSMTLPVQLLNRQE